MPYLLLTLPCVNLVPYRLASGLQKPQGTYCCDAYSDKLIIMPQLWQGYLKAGKVIFVKFGMKAYHKVSNSIKGPVAHLIPYCQQTQIFTLLIRYKFLTKAFRGMQSLILKSQ